MKISQKKAAPEVPMHYHKVHHLCQVFISRNQTKCKVSTSSVESTKKFISESYLHRDWSSRKSLLYIYSATKYKRDIKNKKNKKVIVKQLN